MKKTGSNEFLSHAALDYYNRNRDRGLEKYFLKSNKGLKHHRASSDSSICEKNASNENISLDFAKSLGNLKISDCEVDKSHETSQKSIQTNISDNETSYEEVAPRKRVFVKSNVPECHEVKEISTMTDPTTTTSDRQVNLNLQSKIEIIMPPQQQPVKITSSPKVIESETEKKCEISKEILNESAPNPPQVPEILPPTKILYSTETQTVADEEPPIKPDVKPSEDVVKPDDFESSPNESVTSREQRLEWDSLADVGYNPFQICDKSALTSTEKRALKSYLSRKGLTSSENIIVFKNTPEKQEIHSHRRPERRRSLNYNENWLEVYTKYKDKYAGEPPKTIQKSFKPDAQSTPLDQQFTQFVEKSAQTSLINLLCKSIQVEPEIYQKKESETQSEVVVPESLPEISVKNFGDDTNQTDFSLETGSFVFVAGSPEKKSSLKTETQRKSPKKHKKRSLTGAFESQLSSCLSVQESSNIQTTAQTSNFSSNFSKRTSQTSSSSESTEKKVTSFDEELKMAFALMNSVVESKTMHNEMKKSLINKILQRIINLKISTSQGDEISYKNVTQVNSKEKSSSVSSIQSSDTSRHVSSTKETIDDSDKFASTVKSQETRVTEKSSSSNDESSRKRTIDEFVKETLKPMTHSEIDFQNHKASSSSGNYVSDHEPEKGSMSKKIEKLFNIEKEIERLTRMRESMKFNMKKKRENAKIYENIESLKEHRTTSRVNSATESHKSTKKNERSRLCTPTSEPNLTRELLQRKEKFVELYENQCGKLYEHPGPSEVIYTKPYGTRESVETTKTVILSRNTRTRSSHATSIASSDILSSRSISVPMGNTVTNTSTHQYDIERITQNHVNGVETQTTDSLKRILPIFENKVIKTSQKTQIVDKTKLNKQIQTTCPDPVAYSIVFDDDYDKKPKKCTEIKKKSSDDDDYTDTRTLKEHLNEKRPQIRQTMDERNECIKELRRLRQLRNEQRKKLLLLTSETSLREKIRNLPPSPLGKQN